MSAIDLLWQLKSFFLQNPLQHSDSALFYANELIGDDSIVIINGLRERYEVCEEENRKAHKLTFKVLLL